MSTRIAPEIAITLQDAAFGLAPYIGCLVPCAPDEVTAPELQRLIQRDATAWETYRLEYELDPGETHDGTVFCIFCPAENRGAMSADEGDHWQTRCTRACCALEVLWRWVNEVMFE